MSLARIPDWALVALGGFLGTLARLLLDEAASPSHFLFLPWSTLTVNVVGAFFLGALSTCVGGLLRDASGRDAARVRAIKTLGGSGFAGAFTTYGTYAVATVNGVESLGLFSAFLQSLTLLGVGVLSAWVGSRLGRNLARRMGRTRNKNEAGTTSEVNAQ